MSDMVKHRRQCPVHCGSLPVIGGSMIIIEQAAVIRQFTTFSVECYVGGSKHLDNHHDWEEVIMQHEVLVMTPQIFLYNLEHCFIKMEFIALLIFDECHHAQNQNRHPYAQIMKDFYRTCVTRRPRIFGMTASPVVGKAGANQMEYSRRINSLESLLDAKICTVADKDKDELERMVAAPKMRVHCYSPVTRNAASSYSVFFGKFEEIQDKCVSFARNRIQDPGSVKRKLAMLWKAHENLLFCLENLGIWGAKQAALLLSRSDQCELTEITDTEDDTSDIFLAHLYLKETITLFDSYSVAVGSGAGRFFPEALEEPFFSKKLLLLIEILGSYRERRNVKCIIFVKRIIVAKSLAHLLGKIQTLDYWACDYLIGVHSKKKSRNMTKKTVANFSNGKVNLLVATNVAEEGLDIQTCCLVIRFDLPDTLNSFIQARGRARMQQSEYIYLVERDNEEELNRIFNFISGEERMNREIACRSSTETYLDLVEKRFIVEKTGASVSTGSSISMLHHYCSKLPRDEYFTPRPQFSYLDDGNGTICILTLPPNAPLHQVKSLPFPSADEAKRNVCLKACEELHALGCLSDYLLPGKHEVSDDDPFEYVEPEDEDSHEELYEMLVPTVLQVPWEDIDSSIYLNFYYIDLSPTPPDRSYADFGLFIKSTLPEEALMVCPNLHLDRGRIVRIKLVPSGSVLFNQEEITYAQKFQEMWLKIILSREDLFLDFVDLGKSCSAQEGQTTFYLLLPVKKNSKQGGFGVDWYTVGGCLSSPVFSSSPSDAIEERIHVTKKSTFLQFANGAFDVADVPNSVVVTSYNKLVFCVVDILYGMDGYSILKSEQRSYSEHFKEFDIILSHPEQPLLKAKQLFNLKNLLQKRIQSNPGKQEKQEHFIELPPEICSLKVLHFSKEIASTISLLPSLMHHLENLLVAIELKGLFSASFPEGSEISALRILEALTTERCCECFSLERLEILGDAFLKYMVGKHLFLLHGTLDEGQLTRRRCNIISNYNLYQLAIKNNLQVYIRDRWFDPQFYFALGRPCPVICNKNTMELIHSQTRSDPQRNVGSSSDVWCNKHHHWLHRKTISDVVEALLGAFVVDCGFRAAAVFLRWIGITMDFNIFNLHKMYAESQRNILLMDTINTDAIEDLLGYKFVHKGLLLEAFVHPSYNKHGGGCYQRLEFLGDAVLDYLITSYVYSVYPSMTPGDLTDLRSAAVNNTSFAYLAVSQSLNSYLISDSASLSEAINIFANFVRLPDSEKDMRQEPSCPKVLGDLVESCTGAVLLDSGFNLELVWKIVLTFMHPIIKFSCLQLNPVRELHELCQSKKFQVAFQSSVIERRNYSVVVEVKMKTELLRGRAVSPNKKIAERMASKDALSKLKVKGYKYTTKLLEEITRSGHKEVARLIGYDEDPICAADLFHVPEIQVLATPRMPPGNVNGRAVSEDYILGPVQQLHDLSHEDSNLNEQMSGLYGRASAKSHLIEQCTIMGWDQPIFVCWKEEGLAHMKQFTYKVIIEAKGEMTTVLESFSEPRAKKKCAQEQAAEGALWCLRHLSLL